jgi:hypothetical protein
MKNKPPRMIITHVSCSQFLYFVRVQFVVMVNNKNAACGWHAIPFGCYKHPYIPFPYLFHFGSLPHCAAAFQSALRRLQRVNFIQINAAGRTDKWMNTRCMCILSSGAPFQFPNTSLPVKYLLGAEWDAPTMRISISLSAFHQKRNLIFLFSNFASHL